MKALHNELLSGKYLRVSLSLFQEPQSFPKRTRFNIFWFKHNSIFRDSMLGFTQKVNELLNPIFYKIYIRQNECFYQAIFYDCKARRVEKTIKLSKSGYVYGIVKQNCVINPYLYALALKIELFKLPRNWKTYIKIENKEGSTKMRVHKETGAACLQFTDNHYNNVKKSLDILTRDEHWLLFKKYRQYRGLKSLKNKNKLARVLAKIIKQELQKK